MIGDRAQRRRASAVSARFARPTPRGAASRRTGRAPRARHSPRDESRDADRQRAPSRDERLELRQRAAQTRARRVASRARPSRRARRRGRKHRSSIARQCARARQPSSGHASIARRNRLASLNASARPTLSRTRSARAMRGRATSAANPARWVALGPPSSRAPFRPETRIPDSPRPRPRASGQRTARSRVHAASTSFMSPVSSGIGLGRQLGSFATENTLHRTVQFRRPKENRQMRDKRMDAAHRLVGIR